MNTNMKKIIIGIMLAIPLSACGPKTPPAELGEAPAAKMPDLPDSMKAKAVRLPDIADRSLGGIHRDGINTDGSYNALALRYNSLVDAWACVKGSLDVRDAKPLAQCFAESIK